MLYWSYLKINSFWIAGTVLCYMLTIVLEVKCKRGPTSPNFASNVKNFFISFHYISFHSVSFYFILSHFISCLSISTTFNPFLSIQFHFIPLHSITFNFISLYSISFYSIPSHFIPFIPFHYVCIIQPYETDRNKSRTSLVKLKNIQIHTSCSL